MKSEGTSRHRLFVGRVGAENFQSRVEHMNRNEIESLSREELVDLVLHREREMEVLLESSRRYKDHFHLESLLKEVLNSTREVLESNACSIFLVEEDTEEIFFYVSTDSSEELDQIILKKGQGIVGQVVETGQPRIVNRTREDPGFYSGVDDRTGFLTQSLICVPLKIENQVIGALEVLNKRNGQDFTEDDRIILEILAAETAMAIRYVKLGEERSLNERLAVVGNLAAQFFHDLRNSVQGITGYVEIMLMDNPELKRFSDRIFQEVDKIKEMAHEILDFSRGNDITCTLRESSLNAFLQKLHNRYLPEMEKERVIFRLELAEDAVVAMDPSRLERALENILRNGREALGKTDREIVLRGRREGEDAVVEIQDSGKGMDRKTMAHLFQPFYTTGKLDGTGLGMSIVKKILDAHGARIHVESSPGQGSLFRIFLHTR